MEAIHFQPIDDRQAEVEQDQIRPPSRIVGAAQNTRSPEPRSMIGLVIMTKIEMYLERWRFFDE